MADARCLFAAYLPLDAGFSCAFHTHPCTEIIYNDGCAGELFHGQEAQAYAPDTVMVYQEGASHRVENRTAGRQYCVGVVGCGAERLPVTVVAADDAVRGLVAQMDAAAQVGDGLRQERLDLLAGLLALACRELVRDEDLRQETDSPAVRAKRILDSRFHERIDLRALASSLFVSADYLRELFKGTFGDAPMHYLIQRRIDHARDLLRLTDLPVHEVAARCGIENPYYLSRLFRKVMGESPSAYRRSAGKASGEGG